MNKPISPVTVAAAAAVTMAGLAGCTATSGPFGPLALRRENEQLKAVVYRYRDQLAEARRKAQLLDQDNEQLHNLLAQEQSQRQALSRELQRWRAAAGAEPQDTTAANQPEQNSETAAWSQQEQYGVPGQQSQPPAAQVVASRNQPAAQAWLPLTSVPGAEVVRDGDAVRIRITAVTLFDPGSAALRFDARPMLDRVAAVIKRQYPDTLIAIEGHTDSDPIRKSKWRDNHELSVRRAMAVFDYMRTRGGIAANRMVVAGYGPNAPIMPNQTAAQKARNRRVEFVIYPADTRMAAKQAYMGQNNR